MCSPSARACRSNSSSASASPCCARPRRLERLLARRLRRRRQRVVGQRRQPVGEQVRQARERRVELDAAPGPAAATRIRLGADQLQRRRHVRGLHAGERVALQRQPARVDVRRAEPRPGREHQHACRGGAAHALRLADAAERAVVADHQRHRAPRLVRERLAVRAVEIPPVERLRQVRRVREHAVALVGAGDRQAHAVHLIPGEVVLGQEAADRGDPAGDHRVRSVLRAGRVLVQLRGDGRPVGPDAADLGHRGAAVGSDENLLGAHGAAV